MIEEALAAVFEEIEDVLETLGAAVVGIGDFGFVVFATKLAEESNLRAGSVVRSEAHEIGEIGAIHSENEIEMVEVGSRDSTSSSCHREAPPFPGSGHAWIGWIALVSGDSTGGVAIDVIDACDFERFAHDVFCAG